jgi:hypothetical protein
MLTSRLDTANRLNRLYSIRVLKLMTSVMILLLTLLAVGCEPDSEFQIPNDGNGGEDQCLATPICGPDQQQVDSCEEGDDSCEEVTICGSTIYCEEAEVNCLAEAACGPDQQQVDSCEEGDDSCEEVTICGSTIYCEEAEIVCTQEEAVCAIDEESSDRPCRDNGEQCREVIASCSVTYCRPIDDQLLQCEENQMLPNDPFEIEEARVEFDTLWLSTVHNGGCEMHIYSGCFSDFAESAPVQITINIGHDAIADTCRSSVTEEHTFDLTSLRQAYQNGYGVDSGEVILNISGFGSLEYNF